MNIVDNKDKTLKAVNNNGMLLEYASDRLKNDKDVVLKAVRNFGKALEFASLKLRDDEDVVLEAIKQNGEALKFASDRLKNDKDIVLTAIKNCGYALKFTSKRLQDDKEFILKIVEEDEWNIYWASNRLQKDKDIIKNIKNQNLLNYIYDKVESDNEDKFESDREVKKKIVFFDLETNGIKGCSVLSVSAEKYLIDIETLQMEFLDSFTRYYYPTEEYNTRAIDVNGLSKNVVEELRGEADYPEFFSDDNGFYEFIDDVEHLIGHNISFDYSFLIDRTKDYNTYCTMLATTNILKIPHQYRRRCYKYPKLREVVEYYGIEYDEEKLHGSDYDVEMTVKIFKELLKDENVKEDIKKFLKE